MCARAPGSVCVSVTYPYDVSSTDSRAGESGLIQALPALDFFTYSLIIYSFRPFASSSRVCDEFGTSALSHSDSPLRVQASREKRCFLIGRRRIFCNRKSNADIFSSLLLRQNYGSQQLQNFGWFPLFVCSFVCLFAVLLLLLPLLPSSSLQLNERNTSTVAQVCSFFKHGLFCLIPI